jgi:hypothetical protein
VAKSRSKKSSKKTAPKRSAKAAARKKPARKPARKFPALYPSGTEENVIELRPIRERLQVDVARLGKAIGARREAQPELEEALKRMSTWLDDIQEICGPDMSIPIP